MDVSKVWEEVFDNGYITIIKNNNNYVLLVNDDEYEITKYECKEIIECSEDELEEIIEDIILKYDYEDEDYDEYDNWRNSNYEEKDINDWDVDDHLACWFDHMMEK